MQNYKKERKPYTRNTMKESNKKGSPISQKVTSKVTKILKWIPSIASTQMKYMKKLNTRYKK